MSFPLGWLATVILPARAYTVRLVDDARHIKKNGTKAFPRKHCIQHFDVV